MHDFKLWPFCCRSTHRQHYCTMPGFHHSVAVLPFRSYRCRCRWERKCWKRLSVYIYGWIVTRTLIGCPPTAERQKIGFDPICYGTAVTAQRHVGTATAQRNFSRIGNGGLRNSYGICVTAKRQRQDGNGMVETRHKCIQSQDIVFKIRNWSHIATHVLLLLLFLAGATYDLFKKPKAPSFQMRSWWNLARLFLEQIRIDWRSRIFYLTSLFQDGGHDVISRRKVASHCLMICVI